MFAILSFIALNLAIAVLTWWRSRSASGPGAREYFLGQRQLPAPLVALAVLMTNFSTEQLIGLNGNAFRDGAAAIAWEAFGALGIVLFVLVFLPRYYAAGVTTIPEFIEHRCGRPVRRLMSLLMLVSALAIGVPFVLYSGTLAMIGIFDLPERLGWPVVATLLITAASLGLTGMIYALVGGMRGVAISDLCYAAIFLVAATLIPILGLHALGEGNLARGVAHLIEARPAALNPFGGAGQDLPLSALLTGMVVINISAWCANQSCAQKAFAASSLAESQKGMLLAAAGKLVAPFFFVLPGLIAWDYFRGELEHADLAYARLVRALLPGWLVGFFAAAVAGATITSVSSLVHAATTLFAIDLLERKRHQKPGTLAPEGRWLGIGAVVVAIGVTPIIAQQEVGYFVLMKRLNVTLTLPVVVVVVTSVLTRLAWRRGVVPAAMLGASATYLFVDLHLREMVAHFVELHWLHAVAMAFALAVAILLATGRRGSEVLRELPRPSGWRFATAACWAVAAGVVALYFTLWSVAAGLRPHS